MAPYCQDNTEAGTRARQLCPHTCGCDDPHYPLALSLPHSGCGPYCPSSGIYLQRLSRLPCEDIAKDDPVFTAFLDNWEAARWSWPYDWNWPSAGYISGLRHSGCGFLSNATAMLEAIAVNRAEGLGSVSFPPFTQFLNICVESGSIFPVKPLSYYCPVACGCHAGDPHCPLTCPVRTATTPLCPEAQRSATFNYFTARAFPEGSCVVQPGAIPSVAMAAAARTGQFSSAAAPDLDYN